MHMKWAGVMPATTTAFDKDLKVDHAFVAQHAKWLIDQWLHWNRHAGITRRKRNAQFR